MARKYPKMDAPPVEVGIEFVAAIPEAEVSFDTVQGHKHDGTDSKVMFSGFAKITVGTTEPTSPSTGDLWIDIS